MRGGRVRCGGDIGNSLAVAREVALGKAVEEALCCGGIPILWIWRWADEISRFGGDDVCMFCIIALVGHGLAGLAPSRLHHRLHQHQDKSYTLR